jgi:hypothetical protein
MCIGCLLYCWDSENQEDTLDWGTRSEYRILMGKFHGKHLGSTTNLNSVVIK